MLSSSHLEESGCPLWVKKSNCTYSYFTSQKHKHLDESRISVQRMLNLPAEPPGLEDVLWAAGLLNVEAGTLPFLGPAAVLVYVFAAGEVCTVGVVLSRASLEIRYTYWV